MNNDTIFFSLESIWFGCLKWVWMDEFGNSKMLTVERTPISIFKITVFLERGFASRYLRIPRFVRDYGRGYAQISKQRKLIKKSRSCDHHNKKKRT